MTEALRHQLIEARTKALRLIDDLGVLNAKDVPALLSFENASIYNKQLLANLWNALREIDDSLARLSLDDA